VEAVGMKKLAILCTIALVTFLLVIPIVGCQQAQESETEPDPGPVQTPGEPAIEGLKYTNFEYGFSVEYPKDWDVMEDFLGMVFVFMGPLVLEETYYININLGTEQLTSDISVKDYAKMVELTTKRTNTGYNKVNEYSTTISEQPAIVLTCTATVEQEGMTVELKDSVAVFIKDNVGYIITYDVPDEFHSQYADCFDLVISSFRFE